MSHFRYRKIRDAETWEGARRAWEAGETAQSVARRFDVGLDALWRRRAKEDWSRDRPADRPPEPPEGWERRAEAKREAFIEHLDETRELARLMAAVMAGGEMRGELPGWHLGFLLRWRAEHLGPEVATADRERARGQPWEDAVWGEDGEMRGQGQIDWRMVRLFRAEWRAWAGLPDGAAEDFP